MIKRLFFVVVFATFLSLSQKTYGAFNPVAKPNNFFGIHILFPEEIDKAAELVNSNGGDWGYITIPIQGTDRNLDKWQSFMDEAAKKHVIPILRLATEPYYENTTVWRKPDDVDLVDFANFLNSLKWPTKNRYLIILNEVNRFDEWGGEYPSPSEYSSFLSDAYDIFKSRNNNFFIIMSGLDNAAPSDGRKYISEFDYLNQMLAYDPKIFYKIDGFASHSYPNPGFSQPPNENNSMGVASYRYEYEIINRTANSKKLVFITETGWDGSALSTDKIAEYYKYTFDNIWSRDKDKIVAVTPFLLESGGGVFEKFSFMKGGGPTTYFDQVKGLSKTKGVPEREKGDTNKPIASSSVLSARDFREKRGNNQASFLVKLYLKTLFGLPAYANRTK